MDLNYVGLVRKEKGGDRWGMRDPEEIQRLTECAHKLKI